MLTHSTQTWENALDCGHEVKVVALDISRAFDSVWHNGLLSKLMSVGVGGYLYRWIRDFLNNRFIKVVVNGRESSTAAINAGVPQGSILGPTLFLVFINDLSHIVSSQISMFADDTTISAIIPSVKARNCVSKVICNDLENVQIWAEKWLVKFNAKKTQLMTISRKSNRDAGKISFLGETLKEEDSIKLLGVHITKTLDWNFHVNKIAKRAGQHLGIVRKANKLLPCDVLATLYKTRVRSVMEYCGPIWENASKTVLSKLDTIQRKACRVIGHDNDVCSKVNITSLEHRRRVSGLSQLHRMISGTAPDGVVQLLPSFQEPSLCLVTYFKTITSSLSLNALKQNTTGKASYLEFVSCGISFLNLASMVVLVILLLCNLLKFALTNGCLVVLNDCYLLFVFYFL